MEVSLFYLIHPANSNSRENLGILERFLHRLPQAKQSKQLLTKEIRL